MKMNKRYLSLILSSVIAFTSILSVDAAKSVSDLKKEMQERNEKLKETEKEINNKSAQKDEAIKKRNNLDLQIMAMLDDIEDVENIINEKQAAIDEKNNEIETLTQQIEENEERLKNRLKIMYEYGATSYLDLLLEADGLSDLVTRLSVIRSVYTYDKNVINNFVETKKMVEEAKQIIVNEQNEQIEARNILEDKKGTLEGLKREKQAIIDSLNSDIEALKREERQIEEDYNALQRELNTAMNTGTATVKSYTGNGKFAWPSASSTRVTSEYGYRIHPITGTRRLHRGLDIGAPMGSNVLAAESGVVVTAGWNNSYGYYVTINHGSGYVTLYAHNSKLLVSKGQKVNRGDVIAKCGSTGNSTGPHIHFEVMLNGQLQNPRNYF